MIQRSRMMGQELMGTWSDIRKSLFYHVADHTLRQGPRRIELPFLLVPITWLNKPWAMWAISLHIKQYVGLVDSTDVFQSKLFIVCCTQSLLLLACDRSEELDCFEKWLAQLKYCSPMSPFKNCVLHTWKLGKDYESIALVKQPVSQCNQVLLQEVCYKRTS